MASVFAYQRTGVLSCGRRNDRPFVGAGGVAGRHAVVRAGGLFQEEPVGVYLVGVLGGGSIGGVADCDGLAA